MKDQASLNLLIVDTPIDNKALTGHLMLRATSTGLKIYDATGSESELGSGGEMDWANVSANTIHLTSTGGNTQLTTGDGSLQLVVSDTNNPGRTTLQTPGIWDIKLDSYLTKISGTQQMDIVADGSQCPVKITAGANGGDIELTASGTLKYNGASLNAANGLVQLNSDGKIPTSLYETGGSVDLSAYTGGINLNSTNDVPVLIKFNSGNPSYTAQLQMSPAGVSLTSGNDITIQYGSGDASLQLSSGSAQLGTSGSLTLAGNNRVVIRASEGIFYNDVGFNQAGGLVLVGENGKISASLYDAGATMATPQLMFTVPSNTSGLHLEIKAGKLSDGTDSATLINTATSADHRAKVLGNSGGTNWIVCPDTGFGTNFAGWPVKVDVTGLLDPSEISYIQYRWVPTSGDPSDWYAMVYPCATEAPIPAAGGDTTVLENRVTTLETTVGTLNTAVDEILADYGEGSGALVYRVVASATEPENPTEGMIWIETA